MLNKSKIRVKVKGRKQAAFLKKLLLILGEPVGHAYYFGEINENQLIYVKHLDEWVIDEKGAGIRKLKKVSICELIHIITFQQEIHTCGSNSISLSLPACEFTPEGPVHEWLKKARKQIGVTLREVEAATGISHSYISKLEKGENKTPSYDKVIILKEYFNSFNPALKFVERCEDYLNNK